MKNRNTKNLRKKRLYDDKEPGHQRSLAQTRRVRSGKPVKQNTHRSHRCRENNYKQRLQWFSRIQKGLHERLQYVLQAYKQDVLRQCVSDATITSKAAVIKAILETSATVARMQSFYVSKRQKHRVM